MGGHFEHEGGAMSGYYEHGGGAIGGHYKHEGGALNTVNPIKSSFLSETLTFPLGDAHLKTHVDLPPPANSRSSRNPEF